MKQYFKLPGYYEGLTAKRIKQSGRLWLVRIVNDPPPYFFVLIRNFDIQRDKASGARSIGVWRFIEPEEADAKFEELRPLYPEYVRKLPPPKTPEQMALMRAMRKPRPCLDAAISLAKKNMNAPVEYQSTTTALLSPTL